MAQIISFTLKQGTALSSTLPTPRPPTHPTRSTAWPNCTLGSSAPVDQTTAAGKKCNKKNLKSQCPITPQGEHHYKADVFRFFFASPRVIGGAFLRRRGAWEPVLLLPLPAPPPLAKFRSPHWTHVMGIFRKRGEEEFNCNARRTLRKHVFM